MATFTHWRRCREYVNWEHERRRTNGWDEEQEGWTSKNEQARMVGRGRWGKWQSMRIPIHWRRYNVHSTYRECFAVFFLLCFPLIPPSFFLVLFNYEGTTNTSSNSQVDCDGNDQSRGLRMIHRLHRMVCKFKGKSAALTFAIFYPFFSFDFVLLFPS